VRSHFTTLLATLTLVPALALTAGCRTGREDPEPEQTGKAIDETRDEAAETRADIEDKKEELSRQQSEVASERGEFIAATERTLAELDRQIHELRLAVRQRSGEFKDRGKAELERRLAELEQARVEAQAEFDRFRQATSEKAAKIKQETQTAIARTRAAYDALRGRAGNQDEDPDMKGVDEGPLERNPSREVDIK
jgi:chromosome segregation ATPase